MRKPSRMIVALVLAAGCSSKSEPAPGNPDQQGNVQPQPEPKADPKPAAVQPIYETDPAKHAIPAGPVSGVLAGEPVTGEARLEGRTLIFRSPGMPPARPWQVWLELPPEARRREPYRVVLTPDQLPGMLVLAEFPKPVAMKQWELFQFHGVENVGRWGWQGGCSLTLELGKREKGRVAGKIYLALGELDVVDAAQRRSFLAGAFEAECPRQPTDPPTEDDVPFVNGSVAVRAAAPGAVLRVGYAAAPTETESRLGGTDLPLGNPDVPWSQADHDRPRVSSLITGNGKDVPNRYEHSKLSPGRYLVFAQLKDGPAAWKWVTVQQKSTLAVDLTIDASQVGGVEVTVPIGVLGKVQMAPGEEPGQPPVGPEQFLGIAFQMNLERDIIANKVLFKNLAPGKYEVRAGNRSRVIEIVAGKTLELDLDKPEPQPPAPKK